ncbi:glutathione S-transferase family protein [Leptothrix discophora]|uniref:Glutathione S-transferase family protein n=1 Tax=Leptothrix discophora TaxID=89 RepID=A0ABT9G5M2_LEPDI|nr:glutathione S-transferase family protein [Leptothrix discophora]MDP4301786.1 glutathione S-transferase family protein [Leptothrix discophora]
MPSKTPSTTARTTLTLSSKNYSSWSLRGWLMCRFAGLPFDEVMLSPDDPDAKAEMLLLAPSMLVPCLRHEGATVWDTLAIGEYLHEVCPDAGLLPADRLARARCRAISGEMHSGFSSLRSALPMNLKGRFPGYKVWSRAATDIERVLQIWRDSLAAHGGPYLFGATPTLADAMYAPVVTRLQTYDVQITDPACAAYARTVLALPEMQEWTAAARAEPEAIDELEVEF